MLDLAGPEFEELEYHDGFEYHLIMKENQIVEITEFIKEIYPLSLLVYTPYLRALIQSFGTFLVQFRCYISEGGYGINTQVEKSKKNDNRKLHGM